MKFVKRHCKKHKNILHLKGDKNYLVQYIKNCHFSYRKNKTCVNIYKCNRLLVSNLPKLIYLYTVFRHMSQIQGLIPEMER